MSELDGLMKKPGNEYLEFPDTYEGDFDLHLETINETAVLPFEEIVRRYPKIRRIYLSPLWESVNMRYIMEHVDLDDEGYGGPKYIHPDYIIRHRIDNLDGVVTKSLGENKKLQELLIIRNFVFENIMGEIGKLVKLRKLVFIWNRFMKSSQYSKHSSQIHDKNSGFHPFEMGESKMPEGMDLIPIGNLRNLESLELINKGIKYIPKEFNGLDSLRALNVSWNKNVDLTGLQKIKNLEFVKINNVNMETLPQFIMESVRTLKSVEIRGNPIRDIDGIKQLLKQNKEINIIVDDEVKNKIRIEAEYRLQTDKSFDHFLWEETNFDYVELECCNLTLEKEEEDISNCKKGCGRIKYVWEPGIWRRTRSWWAGY